jgi:hypothetical protein
MKSTETAVDRFSEALKQVLQISKGDVARMLAEEKRAKAHKPKGGSKSANSASDHASNERD